MTVRILVAASATLALVVFGVLGILLNGAVEDRRLAEAAQAEAERSRAEWQALADARIARHRAEAPPPALPAPEDSAALAGRERLAAEVARLTEELAALTAASENPPPHPIEAALRAALDRALDGAPFEPGPAILPLVAETFRDAARAPAAIRVAGSLPGVTAADLLHALEAPQGSGDAFREAAREAFRAVARRGDVRGLALAVVRRDPATDLGRALAAAFADLDREAQLAALDGDEDLEPDVAALLAGTLLPHATASEGRALGRALVRHAAAREAAMVSAIGPEAAAGIAAEILAAPPTAHSRALLARVARGEGAAAAFAIEGVSDALQRIAGERGRARPRSAEELRTRVRTAEPLDAPDILEALDCVAHAERVVVAAVVASIGHPGGEAALRRLVRHHDPDVRARVMRAIEAAELRSAQDVLAAGATDDDIEVARAAAAGLDALGLALDPARGVAALERLKGASAECVCRALFRRPASASTTTALLEDALARGALADMGGGARFLFALNEAQGPEYPARFLGHAHPLVRAAAVLAIRPSASDAERWAGVIDRVSADPDSVVRACASRSLARAVAMRAPDPEGGERPVGSDSRPR